MAGIKTSMVVILKIAVEFLVQVDAYQIGLQTVIAIQVTTTLIVVTMMEEIVANVRVWMQNLLVGILIAGTQFIHAAMMVVK